jgi:hypothetical protein
MGNVNELNMAIAEMLGYNGDTVPNWSGDLRCAWQLMEEMNRLDSPIDWAIFRKKLIYTYGIPIGHPEQDFCESICRALLDARRFPAI